MIHMCEVNSGAARWCSGQHLHAVDSNMAPPNSTFLGGVRMLHGFSRATLVCSRNPKTRTLGLTGYSKLSVDEDGCLSLCVGPVIYWRLVQIVPLLETTLQ